MNLYLFFTAIAVASAKPLKVELAKPISAASNTHPKPNHAKQDKEHAYNDSEPAYHFWDFNDTELEYVWGYGNNEFNHSDEIRDFVFYAGWLREFNINYADNDNGWLHEFGPSEWGIGEGNEYYYDGNDDGWLHEFNGKYAEWYNGEGNKYYYGDDYEYFTGHPRTP